MVDPQPSSIPLDHDVRHPANPFKINIMEATVGPLFVGDDSDFAN
jgi:hypothetical protein